MNHDFAAIGRYYLDRATHVAAHLEAGYDSRTEHCTESPCETGESVDGDIEFLEVHRVGAGWSGRLLDPGLGRGWDRRRRMGW